MTKTICDVIHFMDPTPPHFPAKCRSGVPFFIYFAEQLSDAVQAKSLGVPSLQA